jgi:hypothetical protein
VKKLTVLFSTVAVLTVGFAGFASAETLAYSDPASTGNQLFPGNLALDFTVTADSIDVNALGVFAPTGAVLGGPITVALYNTDTNTLITSAVFVNGVGTPVGGTSDIVQTIADVILGPGDYAVDAIGFGNPDANGNVSIPAPPASGPALASDPILSFTGAAYDSNNALDLPTTCLGCAGTPPGSVPNQFDAGTFEYSDAPEPGTFGMFGLGSVLVLASLRRNRKSGSAVSL